MVDLSANMREKRANNTFRSVWCLSLIDVLILHVVNDLGKKATYLNIMQAIGRAGGGAIYHKQNFRRLIDTFVDAGCLSEHSCRIWTGGRPATRRFEITDRGEQLLKTYCGHVVTTFAKYTT